MVNGARPADDKLNDSETVEHYTQWYIADQAGSRIPVSEAEARDTAILAREGRLRNIVKEVYCVRTDYLVRHPYGVSVPYEYPVAKEVRRVE